MDGLPDTAPPAPTPPQQQPKRDEWSESGISRLLEAYEAKWLLRNRAKLKWSDWVDIAHDVSAHCSSSSSDHASKPGTAAGGTAKTPNQCKNKVESMKKRYRAESAAATRAGVAGAASASGGPSWRFFGRMDGLLKGPASAGCSGQPLAHAEPSCDGMVLPRAPLKAEPEIDAEADVALQQPPDTAGLSELLNADANGSATVKAVDQATHKDKESSRAADSDAANVSSPRSKEIEANDDGAEEVDGTPRKRKGPELDVARSIELLASSFVKIERARLEVYRDTERMRAEAEVKKGEMELRRTEIMAKTQLQIARLFAKRLKECVGSRNGGSSSEMDTPTKKGENGSG
ncbi:trihelix transcription factor ASIL2-like [Hordeum vulgare subsp. vulgare]|uniref:Myb/SANT-like DNA-binding domain-containing protein n=1 Tax=Hordeum vulgare subsp. vulgare TaxID=112509 RepID=A0A8I7B9P9_HORVV|nr:trihelix transcription factor ASIL2-like [Hordeum vulgare subsp. vulgare]